MKETGGPAFGSYHRAGEIVIREGGLTIRDWFAANAPGIGGHIWQEGGSSIQIEVARAYRWADAMLKEREK